MASDRYPTAEHPEWGLFEILRLIQPEIDRVGKADGNYIFSQFDAGHLCAARTIIEHCIYDREALVAFAEREQDDRLRAVLRQECGGLNAE